MASINDVYGNGQTLKATDLPPGVHVPVTISTVRFAKFDDGNKIELTFVGKEKVLICNKTNAGRIAMEHGEDYEAWVGCAIVLHQDVTDYQGRPCPCVRVVPHTLAAPQKQELPATPQPQSQPKPQPQGVPAAQTQAAMKNNPDEIPF